jgi:hypothetical protein
LRAAAKLTNIAIFALLEEIDVPDRLKIATFLISI